MMSFATKDVCHNVTAYDEVISGLLLVRILDSSKSFALLPTKAPMGLIMADIDFF